MSCIWSNDEGQIEEDLFTFTIGDLMKVPVLVLVSFIPLEAFAVGDGFFHGPCILQRYTRFVKFCDARERFPATRDYHVAEIIASTAFLASAQAKVSPIVLSRRTGFVDCVHYYKDAMLGRFFAICNCCSCCCGAMQAQRNGAPMLASSGYVAAVDAELCAACGSCADFCQFAAISIDDGFARIDAAACMGCGVCAAQCPQQAINLVRDPAKGEPLEIQKLIAQAIESWDDK